MYLGANTPLAPLDLSKNSYVVYVQIVPKTCFQHIYDCDNRVHSEYDIFNNMC